MANAGYGNHVTSDPKVAEAAQPDAAGRKPGAGAADRPGADLGGAQDRPGPQGALAGGHSVPASQGTGPHNPDKDSTSPTLSDDDRRDQSTPGAGALPSGGAGNDVDPGAG